MIEIESAFPRRIIVTGDLWRPGSTDFTTWDQRSNVAWLSAIVDMLAANNQVIVWKPESFADSYGEFMAFQNLKCDAHDWATCFKKPVPEFIARALAEAVDSVLIGFEMPPGLVASANSVGIPIINLMLHPIRCLDDLLFTVETDGKSKFYFEPYDLKTSDLRLRVTPLVAQIARERAQCIPIAPPIKAAVFGQVPMDRSLIADGNFSQLSQYRDKISLLTEEAGTMLMRAHPASGLTSSTARSLATIKNLFVTDRSAYDILTDPNIELIVSMSSSVLVEAELLRKPNIRLMVLEPTTLNNIMTLSLEGFLRGLCSLLGIPSSPAIIPPDALRNIVGQKSVHYTDILAGYRRTPPPMPDRQRSFSERQLHDALVQGFAYPEDWGVRMTKAHSVLEFARPTNVLGKRNYVLTVQATSATEDTPAKLSFYSQGSLIDDVVISGPEFVHLEFSIIWVSSAPIVQIQLMFHKIDEDNQSSGFGHGLALWTIAAID